MIKVRICSFIFGDTSSVRNPLETRDAELAANSLTLLPAANRGKGRSLRDVTCWWTAPVETFWTSPSQLWVTKVGAGHGARSVSGDPQKPRPALSCSLCKSLEPPPHLFFTFSFQAAAQCLKCTRATVSLCGHRLLFHSSPVLVPDHRVQPQL